MTLETANPVIICLILLPFVVCSLVLIAGVLNHHWKHKSEKMGSHELEYRRKYHPETLEEEAEEP